MRIEDVSRVYVPAREPGLAVPVSFAKLEVAPASLADLSIDIDEAVKESERMKAQFLERLRAGDLRVVWAGLVGLRDQARLDTLDLKERSGRPSVKAAPLNQEEYNLLRQRQERLGTIEDVLDLLEHRIGVSWQDRNFRWEDVLGTSQPPSQQVA